MIRGGWSVAKRRAPETPAESDRRKAIAKSHDVVEDFRQMMLDSAAAIERSTASIAAPGSVHRPPVILQLGPRDFSVLASVRDEGDESVYRVVKDRIKAASTAAVLARKLQQQGGSRRC